MSLLPHFTLMLLLMLMSLRHDAYATSFSYDYISPSVIDAMMLPLFHATFAATLR